MIEALFVDDRFKDFNIKGKDCEVKVHKAVLAIGGSEYFKTLASSSVGNSFVDNYLETDLDISSLNYLVNFIYEKYHSILDAKSDEDYENKLYNISYVPNFREIYSVIDRFLCNGALLEFKLFLNHIEIESIPPEDLSDYFEICLKTGTECAIRFITSGYLYDLVYKHNISSILLSKIIAFNRVYKLLTKEIEKIISDKNVTLEIFLAFCDDPRDFPFLLMSKMFTKSFISNRTFNALSLISSYKLNEDVQWYRIDTDKTPLQVDYGIHISSISDNKFNFKGGQLLEDADVYFEIQVSDKDDNLVDINYKNLCATPETEGYCVIGVL